MTTTPTTEVPSAARTLARAVNAAMALTDAAPTPAPAPAVSARKAPPAEADKGGVRS